jgi:hypothetical protein
MARYVAWLGQLGTFKASSLQTYLLEVNGFFKDHGLEANAHGDHVAKVRKGLAASHVAIDNTPIRVHLPTSIVVKALYMAQTLRLQLTWATTRAALQGNPTLDQVRLLRACTIVLLLSLISSRGGLGIDCLTDKGVGNKRRRTWDTRKCGVEAGAPAKHRL